MSETTNPELNIYEDVMSSFAALLPEDLVDSVAGFKKNILTNLRSTIDSMVDYEMNSINNCVENARQKRAAHQAANPVEDADV
jgi:hypothetical protein